MKADLVKTTRVGFIPEQLVTAQPEINVANLPGVGLVGKCPSVKLTGRPTNPAYISEELHTEG